VVPVVGTFELLNQTIRPDNNLMLNEENFNDARFGISSVTDYLNMAQADLSGVSPDYLPEKYRYLLEDYRSVLSSSQETVDFISKIISGLPEALGVNGEKKYIIWFQNSNEIRPTGGFIGSYAVLKIESGKIVDLFIDDIYNPDGQIDLRNIKTDPPGPIKDFLGEETLYLRNSNWNPDFTKSAEEFDDIYFKITGETIDGYMAIDLDFVERVLEVTGPIFLASYNEDISAQNLDERAQYYSGFDYREGSSDKKSFLTVLGGKLLERIFSVEGESKLRLAEKVVQSLDQSHMQIYFINNPINSLLNERGWDGGLINTDGDYLFVVNSNLGGTKSNYYVQNKMTYEVNSMTRDGLLRANLYLDYVNNAEDASWPGGPYTDYVRVITQKGTKLTGAKIIYGDGEELDIFDDLISTEVGRYNSFETSFKIGPKESVRIVYSYDLPSALSITKDKGGYSLVWQKQAGTSKDDYSFIFNIPFGSNIELKTDNLEYVDGVIKDSGVLENDIYYGVKIK
jgi:hypothetical protein